MTYTPPGEIALPMVSPHSPWGFANNRAHMGTSAPASAAYEAANRAVYYPVFVPTTCVVRRLWWANGSTVSASYHVDVGIYVDAGYKPGAKLISTGSTAQGTASEVQFVDVTDTTLQPRLYWIAVAMDTLTGSLFRTALTGTASTTLDAVARFQESSAFALPATATPIESGSGYVYLCGFATTASP